MPKFKYFSDKDPWMLAEDIPDIDFLFCQIWLSCFVNELSWPSGRAYKKILSIHRGYHQWFYYGEQNSKEIGDSLVRKFVKNPGFVKRINKEIPKQADRLRNYAEKLPETNLDKYTNRQLWQFYKKHDELHTKYYQWCWIPVGSDMFHSNLTERLKQYLRTIGIIENKINEYFVLLTQPTKKSLLQIEHEEFLKIAIKAQKDKMSPEIHKLVQKHYEKYFYVSHMWIGRVSSSEYYFKELGKLVNGNANLEADYKKEQKESATTLKKRQKLIKKLKIKESWLTLFNGFGDFMVTKIYRRFAQIYVLYKMEYILKEIGKRLKLSLKEVRFILPEEIKKALLIGRVNRKEIKERTKYCVYYAEKGKDIIFIGEKAKKLAKTTERKIENTAEIKGQTGCVGKAIGIAKLIFRPKDMAKMNKGDILVSIATDPDIVPAMKKAAAIVTEQGGVTSHAAIVSRELNIPCVIGTKIATKVLKDGDKVEVDANKGVVRKIK